MISIFYDELEPTYQIKNHLSIESGPTKNTKKPPFYTIVLFLS